PPEERFTTYNFGVAEFATYFVGESGVWVHNQGDGLCERVFSLYKQIVDTRGLQNESWEAFKVLAEKTAHMSERIDAALPKTTDVVMRQAYAEATPINAPVLLEKVPTHHEVTREVLYGRLKNAKLESNHTIPRYVQKLLGITDHGIQDSAPSLILRIGEHQNAPGSFHDILYGYIPKDTAVGDFTEQQLLSLLEQAYQDFGRPEVWSVAREWYNRLPVS